MTFPPANTFVPGFVTDCENVKIQPCHPRMQTGADCVSEGYSSVDTLTPPGIIATRSDWRRECFMNCDFIPHGGFQFCNICHGWGVPPRNSGRRGSLVQKSPLPGTPLLV